MSHTFHIPVLGLAYSIDTPLKVARYGISSVVSIVDDQLIERMRELHTPEDRDYQRIDKSDPDHRSKRITSYLDLLQDLVDAQHLKMRNEPFLPGSDISRYFELLPAGTYEARLYRDMLHERSPQLKSCLQNRLRNMIKKGSIDVNIMAKVDKLNGPAKDDADTPALSDALAALKGFAESKLASSLTLSAGMNPRLYGFLENFDDFYPGADGFKPKKKIILKVSDFRSALIQAKFLAKKGVWVGEFRIESGLNCGGHAFATDGYLMGPILEEFRQKKAEMRADLFGIYQAALQNSRGIYLSQAPEIRITFQGGIGTAEENEFLTRHYQLDGTGWGSPFLLVPEVTNVDPETLADLADASGDDFYISNSSPLGVPFNNFRRTSAEKQRLQRIEKGVPGSPCTKKYLVSNTEFTPEPICTASRKYQKLKIKQLDQMELSAEDYTRHFNDITEKICLCEGLCASVYLKNNILKPRENRAVTICPGPNTAFFSKVSTLDEMVRHIYGENDLLRGVSRPDIFTNELKLYISYLKKEAESVSADTPEKKIRQLEKFRTELYEGINYYKSLLPVLSGNADTVRTSLENTLPGLKHQIDNIFITASVKNSEPDHIPG